MLELSKKNVHLNVAIDNKADAIRFVALGLNRAGYVAEDFDAGMLARETQASTYLGCGIAIPHTVVSGRHLVKNTGIYVCQIPQGIDWDGNVVYVVVGLAAKPKEHNTLLRKLTHIFSNNQYVKQLAKTQDLDTFIAILNGEKVSVDEKSLQKIDDDIKGYEATFTIVNEYGLHARPSAILVDEVKKYDAKIMVQNLSKNTPLVNAKSLMKVVSLGSQKGHQLRFVATGNEAEKALQGIGEVIASKLGE